MAVTVVASGTGTVTVAAGTADTERAVMATNTTSGVYVLMVDLGTMLNGDVTELRIYAIVNSSSERLAYYAVYAHAQAQPMKYSVPIPSLGGSAADSLRFTLWSKAGVVRSHIHRTVTIG